MNQSVAVAPIARSEVEPAVRIFYQAFAPNVHRLYGPHPRPGAMVDVWEFAREVEPDAFLAARSGDKVSGYALFTSSVHALQRRALLSGRAIVWATRALSGRYGLRWSAVLSQLWNKVLFVGSSSSFRTSGDAQLLNIAVAADARGRGIATALLRSGMTYLASRAIREVRLEVEPDNVAAIAAYHSVGFVERGRLRNVYGDWIVMTADPVAH